MSISQKNTNYATSSFNLTNYLPAIFKKNKSGWIIEYYIENPLSKKLQRKQIKLNRLADRYKTQKEAIVHINKMVADINFKLSMGWNPFFESDDARLYTPISVVIDKFIEEKEKENRKDTLRSYRSFTSILLTWINRNSPGLYSSMFSDVMAAKFMDYVYNDRKVSTTTYNNYLKMARALFNWMMEKYYAKQNPFNRIKGKKNQDKKRIIIPKKTRELIVEYLQANNPYFILVCKLMHTSLMRPKEILYTKIKDVNIDGKYIRIPKEVAKNGKERFAAINQSIIDDIKKINIEKYSTDFFLFGSELLPSKNHASESRFRKEWDKIRKALNLPAEMQLYGLRDTGIFEMIKSGIDDLTVMQHADHHSLDMTTKYANHHDPNLIKTIYEKSPEF